MIRFPAVACAVLSANLFGQSINPRPGVIPTLRSWEGGTGTLQLPKRLSIVLASRDREALLPVAGTLRNDLRDAWKFGARVRYANRAAKGEIEIKIDHTNTPTQNEGYRIDVSDRVTISASTKTGIFYGTRTLLQMLALSPNHLQLPKGSATDWPDYHERGFMLDVGRKFFDIRYIREYVRFMAWYKLNDFQLHLNDNAAHDYSGFRLKSDKFPGLANVDGAYSKEEITALQDLADEYHVTITPEFDAPAHARALTKYKPELANPKLPKDHLDLANPASQQFVDQIWREFGPWFRAEAFHIGADEYNGGPGSSALYKAYINNTAKTIRSLGKRVRMWGGLKAGGGSEGVDRNIVVNLWYPGYHDPLDAAKDGYKMINTQDGYLYIVPFAGYYYQFLNTRFLYSQWKPNVFGNEKLPDGDPLILGGMFAVWNDKAAFPYVFEDVHELVKPAMPTLGEVLWAGHMPGARAFTQFDSDRVKLGDGPGVEIAVPPVSVQYGDLAFATKTDASTAKTGDFGCQNVVDGRSPTRWIASSKTPQWISLDLGQASKISQMVLRWAPDCQAKSYSVSGSLDGKTWTPIYATKSGKGGSERFHFPTVSVRYVKLDCLTKGGSENSFSLFGIEAYH